MKNLKIVNYQRNGTRGNGFFVATFGNSMLATFEVDDNDVIDPASCRVVDFTNLSESWRGDDFAFQIQEVLDRQLLKYASIYDVMLAHSNNRGGIKPVLRKAA